MENEGQSVARVEPTPGILLPYLGGRQKGWEPLGFPALFCDASAPLHGPVIITSPLSACESGPSGPAGVREATGPT